MADLNIKYGTWTALTITLASLATDAELDAGRESTAVDNTTNLFVDAKLAGQITVGTTPTADTVIEIWVYASFDGTPTYPDQLDGTDSAETFDSVANKRNSCRLAAVIAVDEATSNQDYQFAVTSVASLFKGIMPDKWGVFVTHNTGVNLNSTGGNHEINYLGVEYTSA